MERRKDAIDVHLSGVAAPALLYRLMNGEEYHMCG